MQSPESIRSPHHTRPCTVEMAKLQNAIKTAVLDLLKSERGAYRIPDDKVTDGPSEASLVREAAFLEACDVVRTGPLRSRYVDGATTYFSDPDRTKPLETWSVDLAKVAVRARIRELGEFSAFAVERVTRLHTGKAPVEDVVHQIGMELRSKGLLQSSAETFEFSGKVLRLMRM